MIEHLNLWTAWISILLGIVSGIGMGLFFHRDNWLGGYNSWPRRMIRLGHISFFGLAFLNLSLWFTFHHLSISTAFLPSVMLAAGAILMPTVCFLSAWRKNFRHLFFMPVLVMLTAVISLLAGGYIQ